jgi:hypothetical protein
MILASPFDRDDPVFAPVWEMLRVRFWKIKVRFASRKDEFLEALRSDRARCVIYLGHGHYDSEHDESALELTDHYVGTHDFEELDRFPEFTALIGCNTSVAGSVLAGLHTILLERGARLVLGTTFPVDKMVAGMFLSHFLRELLHSQPGHDGHRDWAQIVRRARLRTRFFSDLIHHLRAETITQEQLLKALDDRERLLFADAPSNEDERTVYLRHEGTILRGLGLIKDEAQPVDFGTIPYPLFFSLFGFPWTTYGSFFSKGD